MTTVSMPRGSLWRSLFSLAALCLLVFFLHSKLAESLLILRSDVSWSFFALGFISFALAVVLQTFRLQMVFRVQGIRVNYHETLYLNFVGLFFNLFFPSAVGGDVAKVYYATKHSKKKMESTTGVILDRMLGFASIILMAVLAVFFFSKTLNDSRLNQMVYLFLLVLLFFILFFASRRFAKSFRGLMAMIPSKKWRERFAAMYEAIYDYKNHKGVLALSILLSFLGQALFVTAYYFVALSLKIRLPIWLFFILVPVITIVSMAPSLGGLGVREAGAIYLFKRFVPTERALALSLLLDLVIYAFSFMGGAWFSLRGDLKSKTIHEMEELQ